MFRVKRETTFHFVAQWIQLNTQIFKLTILKSVHIYHQILVLIKCLQSFSLTDPDTKYNKLLNKIFSRENHQKKYFSHSLFSILNSIEHPDTIEERESGYSGLHSTDTCKEPWKIKYKASWYILRNVKRENFHFTTNLTAEGWIYFWLTGSVSDKCCSSLHLSNLLPLNGCLLFWQCFLETMIISL